VVTRGRAARRRGANGSAPRSIAPLVTLLVLAAVFLGAVGLGQVLGLPGLWGTSPSGPYDRSPPTRISIPHVGVRAKLVEVGHADDGSIATPTSDPVADAGWYGLGPSPGELGTAVIVGHVDTASKPAVFAKLATLVAGKIVEVRRADRRTASFMIDSVETFPKKAFPVQKVFAASARPRLALITCGGAWLGGDLGYEDNVIAFATLVDS
jgi:hypothetical protein